MTIKEKFNIRIARVQEYLAMTDNIRQMKKNLENAEQKIIMTVDADKVEDTFVCIKKYFTTAPAIHVSEIGDNVYEHVKYCSRFDEKPCSLVKCPYRENKRQYDIKKILLEIEQDNQKERFQNIFKRIK